MRGQSTNSTSILVQWDEVPAADKNGIITSYTITYQSLTQNHDGSVRVDYLYHHIRLTGLKEYVNYSITVFASTVKGDGPASNPIIITTDQPQSKYKSVHMYTSLINIDFPKDKFKFRDFLILPQVNPRSMSIQNLRSNQKEVI